MSIEHSIVKFEDFHTPIVMDSWCKSYHDYPQITWIPYNIYSKVLGKYIRHALARGRINIRLAVAPDDTTHVYGWIAYTGDVVHYVYVKNLYREQGLARSLLYYIFAEMLPETLKVSHMPRVMPESMELLYKPSAFYSHEAVNFMVDKAQEFNTYGKY